MKTWLKWLIGNDNKSSSKEFDRKHVWNSFAFFWLVYSVWVFFKLSHNGYTVSIIYIFIALMIAVADQIIVEF